MAFWLVLSLLLGACLLACLFLGGWIPSHPNRSGLDLFIRRHQSKVEQRLATLSKSPVPTVGSHSPVVRSTTSGPVSQGVTWRGTLMVHGPVTVFRMGLPSSSISEDGSLDSGTLTGTESQAGRVQSGTSGGRTTSSKSKGSGRGHARTPRGEE